MSRLVPSLAVGLAALMLAAPALAADYGYGEDFRPAYPDDWDAEDPLGFEVGLRYWYALGNNDMTIGGEEFNSTDRTQFLEGHLRIEDASTGSYVKGLAGYSMAITGEYDTPFGTGDIVDGHIGYAGADFGYNPFGPTGSGSGVYGLVGYQYWNDSPNIGRENFSPLETADDVNWPLGADRPSLPGDSEGNNVDIHALRLGVSGKVEFNEFIDLTGEVAAVPYAWVNGAFGAYGTPYIYNDGVSADVPTSVAAINGFGYGAMGEAMVGFHPTENVTFRLGGRAWYLQGNVETTFTRATITAPQDTSDPLDGQEDVALGVSQQEYIIESNPFSLFRYGALAELTFKF